VRSASARALPGPRRQVADLGEEDAALAGLLEDAGLVRGTLEAEQLRLDERLGKARAVDDEERVVGSHREIVDGARHQLSPAPGLAADEHRRVARRQATQLRQ
jgi:hypothetical protein